MNSREAWCFKFGVECGSGCGGGGGRRAAVAMVVVARHGMGIFEGVSKLCQCLLFLHNVCSGATALHLRVTPMDRGKHKKTPPNYQAKYLESTQLE